MKSWLSTLFVLASGVSVVARSQGQTAPGVPGPNAARQATAKRESRFACDRLALDPVARKRHFDELAPALAAADRSSRELPDGFEFEFPPDAATVQKVLEFAAGERLCCPFFDIEERAAEPFSSREFQHLLNRRSIRRKLELEAIRQLAAASV